MTKRPSERYLARVSVRICCAAHLRCSTFRADRKPVQHCTGYWNSRIFRHSRTTPMQWPERHWRIG
ncbi:hypothetical protein EVA_06535 [gut metagenome]|uniref:Uncharacterized protein n=1 Tax=gut metagenome TaxID=749906 RepID=J9GXA7_9ZZZZ